MAKQFLEHRGVRLYKSEDLRYICRVEGGVAEGRLVAVVAFNGFSGRTCFIHCAGDGNWITREFLREAFEYAFKTCDCIQIFGTVAGDNLRALKLNKHLGFEVLHRLRHGWDEETDLVFMGMHKTQCRWLTERKDHGREIVDAAAA